MKTLPALPSSAFRFVLCCFACALLLPASPLLSEGVQEKGAQPVLANPILFVTQFPIAADFSTIGSTFANHRATMQAAGRGGDLYIRYGNGTLRNLTREAGFGNSGFQGANAISVRDPHLHWDGDRALFSMVVGGPTQQFQYNDYYWQLYEVSGFGLGETVVITRLANQPVDFNNVEPAYSSDGRVLFTSDRPITGERHLYPQHDEYESTATNTGLWSLDPATGDLILLQHSPSGSFGPLVDSYGRVLFTRWDHLQRDQQADSDALGASYGTFDFSNESASAAMLPRSEELFPEPREARTDLLVGTPLEGHRFNHFSPWMILPDGTGEETLNHIGRHELQSYFNRVRNDDPNLDEFIASVSGRFNPNSIENFFQMAEDPAQPGRYFGIEAPEFGTHASGQVVSLEAPPERLADAIAVSYRTHPDTSTVVGDGETPPATHSGHYRDPLPMADSRLVAAHSFETRYAANEGTRANPAPRYDFRLRLLQAAGQYLTAGSELTGGIAESISYWDPDVLVSYSGELWELSPVEVRVRPQPPLVLEGGLAAPEAQIFAEENVDPEVLRAYLRDRDLALIVSRDVTTRDVADQQQPYNLAVAGGSAQTVGSGGVIYDVSHLQLFEAQQLRGIGGMASPKPGRRVLARPVDDPAIDQPPAPGAPVGGVAVAEDGSVAAFVPSRRALSWQLTAPDHEPVVRERYWLTFQPGEIRVCASCHGLNSADQAGQIEPTNPPEALRQLLQHWQGSFLEIFEDGFESGNTEAWSASLGD